MVSDQCFGASCFFTKKLFEDEEFEAYHIFHPASSLKPIAQRDIRTHDVLDGFNSKPLRTELIMPSDNTINGQTSLIEHFSESKRPFFNALLDLWASR